MSKKKLIIILVIANVLLLGVGGTLSAYKSAASGSTNNFEYAAIVFNNEEVNNINIDLSNFYPGDTKTINFKVSNNKDGKTSDVTIEYKLVVRTYRSIPTTITIKNSSNQTILTCDNAHGTRNADGKYECVSTVQTLSYSDTTAKNFTASITYDDNSSVEYSDQNDFIEIDIISEASASNDGIVTSEIDDIQLASVEKVIPDGGIYTSKDGTVYSAGDTIPNSYEPQTGDTYEDSDYTYKFNNKFAIDKWLSNTSGGWGVAVKDQSKISYENPVASINGKPITNLNYAYYHCTNMIGAPIIPDSVTSVVGTYSGCTSLVTPPKLPSSVKSITTAFSGCSSLIETPEFPSGITGMDFTFQGCSSLKTVHELPNTLRTLVNTFDGCTSLETPPEIPQNVYSMYWTFQRCTSLKTPPVLPNSLEYISYAFNGCSSLESFPVIPANVTDIDNAFSGCASIKGDLIINSTSMSIYQNALYDTAKDATHRITIKGSASSTIKNNIKATAYNSGQYVTVE